MQRTPTTLLATALLAAAVLVPRPAAAQHGHGLGTHSGGHAGGHAGRHAGGHTAGGRVGTVAHIVRHPAARGRPRSVYGSYADALLVRHGLHVGLALGGFGPVGRWGYYDCRYGYACAGLPYARARSSGTPAPEPARDAASAPSGDFAGAGVGARGDSLIVQTLSGGILRLTWRPDDEPVEEVALFLADAAQVVLAVQTVRAAPFAALFEPPQATSLVGVTVVRADGRKATAVLPYRAPRR